MNATLELSSTQMSLEDALKMICLTEPDFLAKNATWMKGMAPRESIKVTLIADEIVSPGSLRVVDEVQGLHRLIHSTRVHKLVNMLYPNVIKSGDFGRSQGRDRSCVYKGDSIELKPPTAHEQMELLVRLQEWLEQCGADESLMAV